MSVRALRGVWVFWALSLALGLWVGLVGDWLGWPLALRFAVGTGVWLVLVAGTLALGWARRAGR